MFSTSVDKANALGSTVDSDLSYACDISTADLGTLNIETDINVHATAPKAVEPNEELQVTNLWTEITFNELPILQAIMDNLSGEITGFDLNVDNAVNAEDQQSDTYNIAATPIDISETELTDGEDKVTFKVPEKGSVDGGSFIAGEDGEVVVTIGDIDMSIHSDLGEMPVHCTLEEGQTNDFITIPIEEMDGSDAELSPTIELNGDEPIELDVGEAYEELGATAKDHQGNDLSDDISITGEVDINKAGQYTITYTVADSEGQTSKTYRTILVKESQEPTEPDNGDNRLHYIALGDSLAAGFLNYPDKHVIGNGYPFFIKQGIEAETDYHVNLINRSFGGFTTTNVLNQLENNTSNILEEIADANIITYDAGANDLLGAIDIGNLENIDKETGEELVGEVMAVRGVIENNIDASLQIIKENNPDVPIYVMGYYNAMPWIEGDQAQDLIKVGLDIMNGAIESAAEKNGVVYVPTWDAFVGNYDEFLPNPNIHPMENGYQAIADEFLKEIMSDLPPIEEPNPTDPDTESPVIDLKGDNPMELEMGDTYKEPGATAKDDVDGDVTDNIEITGEVDTSTVGEYKIVYTVLDAAGNEATETRIVNVVETEEVPGEDEKEVKSGEKIDVNADDTVKLKDSAATIKLPEDLPEGTKITVVNEKENELEDLAGRKVAGDVVDVTFEFENEEDKEKEFEYQLTLSVDGDIEEAEIYHYEDGEWILVEDRVKENGTISTTVNHFSKYGVLSNPTDPNEEKIAELENAIKNLEEQIAALKKELKNTKDEAKKDSENALAKVEEALEEVKKAKEAAEEGQIEAEKALAAAELAQKEAEQALVKAEQAKKDAEEDLSNAESNNENDNNDNNSEENDNSVITNSNGNNNGGSNLPITATSQPLVIAIGAGLLLAGGSMMVTRRKNLV